MPTPETLGGGGEITASENQREERLVSDMGGGVRVFTKSNTATQSAEKLLKESEEVYLSGSCQPSMLCPKGPFLK